MRAQGFFHHPVHAPTYEHAAAFDVKLRTAKEKSMMARMNHGAVLPTKCSAIAPA